MIAMFFSKRSKAPEKILNALLEERKSLTELSKLLDISKQALLKHTNQLEQQGLINSKSSEGKGGEKTFSLASSTMLLSINENGYALSCANKGFLDLKYPLLIQIPQLKFRREAKDYLEALQGAQTDISVVLYGSLAKGKASEESDIDLALINQSWTDREEKNLTELLSDTMMEQGLTHPPSLTFLTYNQLDHPGSDIQNEVLNSGILIYVGKDDKEEDLWKNLKRYRSI